MNWILLWIFVLWTVCRWRNLHLILKRLHAGKESPFAPERASGKLPIQLHMSKVRGTENGSGYNQRRGRRRWRWWGRNGRRCLVETDANAKQCVMKRNRSGKLFHYNNIKNEWSSFQIKHKLMKSYRIWKTVILKLFFNDSRTIFEWLHLNQLVSSFLIMSARHMIYSLYSSTIVLMYCGNTVADRKSKIMRNYCFPPVRARGKETKNQLEDEILENCDGIGIHISHIFTTWLTLQ